MGRVLGRFKVGKHFKLTIAEDHFDYQRNHTTIAEEAALDGIYVIRTSVAADKLSAENTVLSYKRLSQVERAFRCSRPSTSSCARSITISPTAYGRTC